ncbi:SAM-dependent methyltransferase [Amycolatopsis pigmentata]|uniref:SAM-dependent methyltransferase n=1 Tax=Amycolatopsis pigmentata TaxID=450801 RepID=A0ABW5FQS2_9PSEU
MDRPSVARVYDYYLGGTANYEVDREFGEKVLADFPLLKPIARANRLFLHRVVRYLAQRGVSQFVDIGSGVPTMGSTHQVADETGRNTRVVYVDHEPTAVAHSRTLLETSGDPRRHAVLHADLREPDELWRQMADTGLIDLGKPVALLLIAVLHVQQPGPDGTEIGPASVARYRELLPPGSYLAISHITDDGVPVGLADALVGLKRKYDESGSPVIWRSRAEIGALMGDFAGIAPGMTWTSLWHPEASGPGAPAVRFAAPEESAIWGGVGHKQAREAA